MRTTDLSEELLELVALDHALRLQARLADSLLEELCHLNTDPEKLALLLGLDVS